MPWVKFSDDFYRHPKIVALSDKAFRLWACAIGYSADNLTDGFIADPVRAAILRQTAARDRHVHELVSMRLFEPCDGGHLIHDYLTYNPSRQSVTAEREAWKERQDRSRSRRDSRVTSSVTPTVTPPVTHASPVPVPVWGGRVGSVSEINSEQEPLSLNAEPLRTRPARKNPVSQRRTKPPRELPPGFADFWSLYPKRVDKLEAEKAWRKLAPSPALVETILQAVENQRDWPGWRRDGGQFIPYAATWINGHRWQDQGGEAQAPDRELIAPGLTRGDWARIKGSFGIVPKPEREET